MGAFLGASYAPDINPVVVPDGAGGSFVAWLRATGVPTADVFAAHLSATGVLAPGWGNTGNFAGTGAGDVAYSPVAVHRAVPDGGGGVYVLWPGYLEGTYAQHLSPIGGPYSGFPIAGKSISVGTSPPTLVDAVSDGRGGVYVAGFATPGVYPELFMKRLDEDGNTVPGWRDGGWALVSGAFDYYSGWGWLSLDSGGRALFSHIGRGANNSAQAVAQVVDHFGQIGEVTPAIDAVRDVSGDQGGHVRIDWLRSPLDATPAYEIDSYWIWRQAPASAALAALRAGATLLDEGSTAGVKARSASPSVAFNGHRVFRQSQSNGITFFWEYVASVAATGYATYSYVAATTRDSMPGGNPHTPFLVQARHRDDYAFWDSTPDSGYSVDNLAPSTPNPFTGQYGSGVASLSWGPNPEGDLAYYRLYRGTTPNFVPGAGNLVVQTTTTGHTDNAGTPGYYKLAAVDIHGNASPYALLLPGGILDVTPGETPIALAFEPPSPHPARDAAHFRFALPERADVQLEIFDVSGRRVAELADRSFEPGPHEVVWQVPGNGSVSGGVYFARLTALGRTLKRRLVLLHR